MTGYESSLDIQSNRMSSAGLAFVFFPTNFLCMAWASSPLLFDSVPATAGRLSFVTLKVTTKPCFS